MIHLKTILLPLAAAAALAGAAVPAVAESQLPSYARNAEETIRGTVASVDGKYNISVRDERGYVDNISLHDGTIINPTGLTLAPGESVTIQGVSSGSTFVANEIDAPYTSYAYPYAVYPAYPAYVYPRYHVGLRFGGRGFGFGFHG